MRGSRSRESLLRILQIIPELSAGGAERTTIDVSAAIIAAGGYSHVIAKGGRLVEELCANGAEFTAMPVQSKNPFIMRQNRKQIEKLAKEFNADILHARSRAPAWSVRKACKQTGIPFVTTYHGTYNSSSALKTFYNSIMASGDLVIANSKFIAAHISKEHGTDPSRIRVIPRGLDLAALKPANISQDRIDATANKLSFGQDPTVPLIVMPGRLTRWKGQLPMIEAASLLREQGIKFHLLLPGDAQGRDAYVTELKQVIKRLGLQDMVSMPGHVSDMAAIYALSQVVVSASLEPEAFGRVAVEGQAAGKPVIATALGGSLETVRNDETGLLVAPDNPREMAAKLAQILTFTENQRLIMGRAGQAWVAGQFSREKMCASTLAVYEELLCEPH